jgi:FMN phosphatase YigB (HAD superfamily)
MRETRPAVALDLGGILLTDPTLGGFWSSISASRGDGGLAARTLWFSELREPFERGELHEDLVWESLASASGSSASSVRRRFLGGFKELPGGIQALRDCKAAGFRVVLATNHYEPWIPMWRSTFDWFPLIDHVVCSSEIGERKPNSRFYEEALAACDAAGYAVRFVDDIPENVEAASAFGFVGLLGDGSGDWITEVMSNGRLS